jgi:hypothetical protein
VTCTEQQTGTAGQGAESNHGRVWSLETSDLSIALKPPPHPFPGFADQGICLRDQVEGEPHSSWDDLSAETMIRPRR